MRKLTNPDPGQPPIVPVVAAPPEGRRRRPSGEPPPLPRHAAASTPWFVAAIGAAAAMEVAVAIPASRQAITHFDDAAVQALARLRGGPMTGLLQGLETLGSATAVRVLAWTTIVVLLAARRVRHLLTYLAVVLTVGLVAGSLALWEGRMRPGGVTIVGDWAGYSNPSVPVANVSSEVVTPLTTSSSFIT